MSELVELYKDYQIYFSNISYNCPALQLYGYSSTRSLKAAITKRIKQNAKRIFG